MLDVEPELGAGLPEGEFEQARQQVVLAWAEPPAGPLDLRSIQETVGAWGGVLGAMVLDGALTQDVMLLGRVCTRLLVAGDLVLFDGDSDASLPVERGWSVPDAARIVVLDHRLLAAGARWPALLAAVFERVARQERQTLTQQAISQLPRVEDRLLAFFWTIADQRGQVNRDGVRVKLRVTHEALGRMVGARRPTVSLGLSALARDGLLVARDSEWQLSHASLDALSIAMPARDRPEILGHPGPARILAVGRGDLVEGHGGHQVERVQDAEAAVARLADRPVDLVVLDAEAITSEGAELIEALRSEVAPRLIVIGSGQVSGKLLAAAHEHLAHPDQAQLWRCIEAQIARAVALSAMPPTSTSTDASGRASA